jgi:hypothetical protein
MSTLTTLAAWVRSLTPDAVPSDVRLRAREQLVAAAGAVRATARARPAELDGRIGVAWVPGAPAGAATAWAGLVARHAWDDPVLAGRVGLGAPMAAWSAACAASADLEALETAQIVANEVGGRVGLALLFGPRATHTDTFAACAGGAAAVAWLRGASADGIADAVAAALQAARRWSLTELAADASLPGRQAAQAALSAGAADPSAARRTGHGNHALLDPASPFWSRLTPHPLHGALGGTGRAWLTRTLLVRAHPGLLVGAVAVEAIQEVLRRHVKAADKRLRADQVERIEVRVGAQAHAAEVAALALAGGSDIGVAASVARSVGVLVAHHALEPSVLGGAHAPMADGGPSSAERAAEAEAVASRVQIVHDWGLTVRAHEKMAQVLAPLLGGPGALRRAPALFDDGLPPFAAQDVAAALRARPDRLLRTLRTPAGDLGAVDLSTFQWHAPVEVKLYTTRGGWWPERRALPLGNGDDRSALALSRFEDEARPRAAEALSAVGSTTAAVWLEGLLA